MKYDLNEDMDMQQSANRASSEASEVEKSIPLRASEETDHIEKTIKVDMDAIRAYQQANATKRCADAPREDPKRSRWPALLGIVGVLAGLYLIFV